MSKFLPSSFPEVIISTSRSKNPENLSNADKSSEMVYVWNLQTLAQLGSFKNNSSDSNCLAIIGKDYFATSQYDSSSLHFWSWRKVCKASVDDLLLFDYPITQLFVLPDQFSITLEILNKFSILTQLII